MSEIVTGVNIALAGNAVANAFWIFIGVVVGALIQYALGVLVARSHRSNALTALRTEIEMNLDELGALYHRLDYLKERIAASQIDDSDLFINMSGFDYSIVNPLISSGHFHVSLGPTNVKRYFSFMRFFNNNNATSINSMLRTEHDRGKSLDYLSSLRARCKELEAGLKSVNAR